MKHYRILKTFKGNQTGNGETQEFMADTVALLSDSLAEVVVKEGWAELALPKEPPAETRETKVTGPDETKPAAPLAKKGKK